MREIEIEREGLCHQKTPTLKFSTVKRKTALRGREGKQTECYSAAVQKERPTAAAHIASFPNASSATVKNWRTLFGCQQRHRHRIVTNQGNRRNRELTERHACDSSRTHSGNRRLLRNTRVAAATITMRMGD